MAEFSTEKVCATPNCNNDATLSCPTCLKLGLPPARFCSQTCFSGYWKKHKEVHTAAKKLIKQQQLHEEMIQNSESQINMTFKHYKFSGSLRPYARTPRRDIPSHISKPDYATHIQGHPLSEMTDKRKNDSIKVYSSDELIGIREACRIGREVLDEAGCAVAVGVTCDDLDRITHEATIKRNAYPSPLNYYTFPKSVCTSVNEVICHGIPDLRPLEDGDIVNIDVSVYYNGYHADLNETFMVGNVDEESKRLVKCAYETLAAAVSICKPGVLYRDCGNMIQKVASKYNCQVVKSYCGHGVGKLFHTAPNIPHYANNKAKGTMQIGHVFTIEPMINLGTWKDTMWPDNWTAPTQDGKRSAQFEHTMVVTETGVELLTARSGDPNDKMIYNPQAFSR